MRILIFMFAIAAFVSCANQKPKHFFYGKWEAARENTREMLVFGDDNLLQTETFGENGESYHKASYRFVIVDEKNVKITYPAGAEYKVRIEARAIGDDEAWLECDSQPSADGRTMIDYPDVCRYKRLKRIKE